MKAKQKRNRNSKYPWDKWLARKRLTLKQGKDFDARPDTFQIRFRLKASEAGLRFSIHIHGDSLDIVRVGDTANA